MCWYTDITSPTRSHAVFVVAAQTAGIPLPLATRRRTMYALPIHALHAQALLLLPQVIVDENHIRHLCYP